MNPEPSFQKGSPLLEMRDIRKSFGGIQALKGVSFRVAQSSIHSLCGENGAGKSTLMKILSGLYPAGSFEGEVIFEGEARKFRSTRESEATGIAMIYQELSLIPELSAAENIFLGHERARFGVISSERMIQEAKNLFEKIGLKIDPTLVVGKMGIGQQQMVEIAKALSKKAKLLVLDEPTSALTAEETKTLLDLLKRMRSEGMSCVLISHKLEEVFEVSDEITVIRDGESVATHPVSETSPERTIAEMVGRELKDLYPRIERKIGEVAFEVKNWSVKHPTLPGRMLLDQISFQARRGEILGVSGLMGAGRSELLLSLFGVAHRPVTGECWVDGRRVTIRHPAEAIQLGLSLVSEDRKQLGLVLDHSVLQNMTLAALKRFTTLGGWGWVDSGTERSEGARYQKELLIKSASLDLAVKSLSGGNQQKVVLTKCLLTRPRVLFLDEPARGIDVGAKAEIFAWIQKLASEGMTVIMVSSEMPELLGVCDRIIVMSRGRLTREFHREEATQEKIMQGGLE